MTTEERVYEFIKAAVDAVTLTVPVPENPLFDLEVHKHFKQKIKQPAGIRVGKASGKLSPLPGDDGFGRFNVEILLVVFVKIDGTQKDGEEVTLADRRAAEITDGLASLFWYNPSCDERFRDTRLNDFTNGYDNIKADEYSVVNLPLLVNEVGGSIGR